MVRIVHEEEKVFVLWMAMIAFAINHELIGHSLGVSPVPYALNLNCSLDAGYDDIYPS
jgi:hypothetical protein